MQIIFENSRKLKFQYTDVTNDMAWPLALAPEPLTGVLRVTANLIMYCQEYAGHRKCLLNFRGPLLPARPRLFYKFDYFTQPLVALVKLIAMYRYEQLIQCNSSELTPWNFTYRRHIADLAILHAVYAPILATCGRSTAIKASLKIPQFLQYRVLSQKKWGINLLCIQLTNTKWSRVRRRRCRSTHAARNVRWSTDSDKWLQTER